MQLWSLKVNLERQDEIGNIEGGVVGEKENDGLKVGE